MSGKNGNGKLQRVALYARVSTGDQTTAQQLHALREWAERRGFDLDDETEVLEFVDDSQSGRKRDRPALARMLKAVNQGKVDAVVVVRLDRLARSLHHMVTLAEEFRAVEVSLVSLSEGFDTSTPAGRAMFGMCGVFAELEADLTRERTVAGVARAVREGKRLGRPPALDAEGVRRLRRLRASGKTQRECAEMLGIGQTSVRRLLGPLA